MKRSLIVIGALLLCTLPALAQDIPKAELFMGYEYVRFNPSLSSSANQPFNLHGGGGAITYNVNKMFGLQAEFTQVGAGNIKVCNSLQQCLTRSGNFFTYMFGPQIAIRNNSRITPNIHLLFGGAHSNVYADLAQAGTITTGPSVAEGTKEAFALAVGVGLDVKASKHVAIRLGQFDYFMTRFSGRYVDKTGAGAVEINNQNNFRILVGVNFLLGSK